MNCKVKVNNVPDMAAKYVVARIDDSNMSLWYWGSFETREHAEKVAEEVGGIVVERGADG